MYPKRISVQSWQGKLSIPMTTVMLCSHEESNLNYPDKNISLCPREELNPYYQLRKLMSYPLNDGDDKRLAIWRAVSIMSFRTSLSR